MAKQTQSTSHNTPLGKLESSFIAWKNDKTKDNAKSVLQNLTDIFQNDKYKWNRLLHMDFVSKRDEIMELKTILGLITTPTTRTTEKEEPVLN